MTAILLWVSRQMDIMPRLRSRQDIMSEVLRQVQEPKVKTHVMYGVNLSYSQTLYYFSQMQAHGLIRQTDDNRWIATEKGRKFLRLCEEAQSILNDGLPSLSWFAGLKPESLTIFQWLSIHLTEVKKGFLLSRQGSLMYIAGYNIDFHIRLSANDLATESSIQSSSNIKPIIFLYFLPVLSGSYSRPDPSK